MFNNNHKLNLHKVLKLSYDNNNNHQQKIKKTDIILILCYQIKKKVYYNHIDNKLLGSVAGTDEFSPKDIITDAYLASGKLQNTSRYKHAHNTIIDEKNIT